MTEQVTMQDQIKQTVSDNNVVLFMKGNANFPQCGFSGKAIQILTALEMYEAGELKDTLSAAKS